MSSGAAITIFLLALFIVVNNIVWVMLYEKRKEDFRAAAEFHGAYLMWNIKYRRYDLIDKE